MEVQASILELYLPDFAYRKSEALTTRRGNFASAAVGIYPGRRRPHRHPRHAQELAAAHRGHGRAVDGDRRALRRQPRPPPERRRSFRADLHLGRRRHTQAKRTSAPARPRPISPVNTVADLLESEHLGSRAILPRQSTTPPPARCGIRSPAARMPATPAEAPPRAAPRPAQQGGLRRTAGALAGRAVQLRRGGRHLMATARTSLLIRQRPPPPPRSPDPRSHDGLGRPRRHPPPRRHGRRGDQGRVRPLMGHAPLAALPRRPDPAVVGQRRLLQPQQPQQVRPARSTSRRSADANWRCVSSPCRTSSSRTTAPTSSASYGSTTRICARVKPRHHPRLDAKHGKTGPESHHVAYGTNVEQLSGLVSSPATRAWARTSRRSPTATRTPALSPRQQRSPPSMHRRAHRRGPARRGRAVGGDDRQHRRVHPGLSDGRAEPRPIGNRHVSRVQGVYPCSRRRRVGGACQSAPTPSSRASPPPSAAPNWRATTLRRRRLAPTSPRRVRFDHRRLDARALSRTTPRTLCRPPASQRRRCSSIPRPDGGRAPARTRILGDREQRRCWHVGHGRRHVWRMSRTPGHIRMPAPKFGEHNTWVLRDLLGLDDGEIAALEAEGVTAREPNLGVHS